MSTPAGGAVFDAPGGYGHARTGAAVRYDGPRGVIAVAGGDAVRFLHGILTNDIAALQPGRSCYAAYLTPQGRMISDMRVLRLPDVVLLDVEAGVAATLAQRLDASLFTEDVRLEDRTARTGRLVVCGPAARDVLAAGVSADGSTVPELQPDDQAGIDTRGGPLLVARTDRLGAPTLDVLGEPVVLQDLERTLVDAGAAALGEAAAEALRIEAGTPLFGVDMTTDTIPLEAGIEDRAISMTKGCYVGQEVIVRILHRGHGRVARRLVGLRIEGRTVPGAGAGVVAGGDAVGHVTSAALSPRAGGVLAFGYVQRAHAEPGANLTIEPGLSARVVRLPLEP